MSFKRLTVLVLLCLLPLLAQAVLRIEIRESAGVQYATPVAIVPFGIESGVEISTDIAAIIGSDLQLSGLFVALDNQKFPSNPTSSGEVVYTDWRTLDTDYLIVGKVTAGTSTQLQVQFEMIDVVKQRRILDASYPIQHSQLRRLSHIISDAVYEKITANRGIFDTRFSYVTVTGSGKNRNYSLALADIDGQNIIRVLDIARPILSPAWSPDGQRLAYVSFEFPGRSAIVLQHLVTTERRKLVSLKGINGAPAWSPDGKRLAMSLSHRGSPDIYIVDVASGKMTQITNLSSIEMEPEWIDNGRILFTSNRSGSPQIYVKKVNSRANAKRLTYEGNYNVAASPSPDGSSFAFVHREDGKDRIAVQSMESSVLRVLTDGVLDESPSFSPNGELILYATQDQGEGVLGVVSADGLNGFRISLSGENVRDPAWGPFRR